MPASLECRDQGADRRGILCARRGGVGGGAAARHVTAASVWLAQGGASRSADVAGRRGADVCTGGEGSRDEGVAAAAANRSEAISIEIAGAVVRAERGVDLGWLRDVLAHREGGDMIAVAAGVKVLVATKPVDFRKGADGLAALVRETLGHDPFSGTIFIFRSKRADRLKILAWDGSGLVLFWKRLEHGAFRWPPVSNGVMRLTAPQLAALVDGMDWSRLHARDVVRPTATS